MKALQIQRVLEAATGRGADRFLVRDGFLAVADGAIPVFEHPLDVGEFTNYALQSLYRAYEVTKEPEEIFRRAIQETQEHFEVESIYASCSVVVAYKDGDQTVLCSLGDASLIARLEDEQDDLVLPGEPENDAGPGGRLIAKLLSKEKSYGLAWEEALPLMEERRNNPERPLQVFGDNPGAAENLVVRRVAGDKISALLLCSDGLTHLVKPFCGCDCMSSLLDDCLRDGLEATVSRLRRIEIKDDHMQDHPRSRLQDDLAALLLSPPRD